MLSSFFKTRHGNISSFHPTFVVFSPDDSNKGELGESSDTAGSKTVQSALMRSIDGSATESLEKRVTKTMAHLICICGLQNGMVECWVLSNSDNTHSSASMDITCPRGAHSQYYEASEYLRRSLTFWKPRVLGHEWRGFGHFDAYDSQRRIDQTEWILLFAFSSAVPSTLFGAWRSPV